MSSGKGSSAKRGSLEVRREFRIKQETPADDEIKEYAETAMNEFLGWYGYDKVNSKDTQGLSLQHFGKKPPTSEPDEYSDNELPADIGQIRDGSCSPNRKINEGASRNSPVADKGLGTLIICCWCSKVGARKMFSLKTPTGQKAFCSELCFSQCRRANFKRNKTCDWCRHIRHTVNYVDFQDGDHQLQFCSDKCLNQYKMNIFCKETEAHLQLHPHPQESVPMAKSPTSNTVLITPDLWLRDCRSESPLSERSPSPPPSRPTPASSTSSIKPPDRKKPGKIKRSHVKDPPPPRLLPSFPPPPLLSIDLPPRPFLPLSYFPPPPMFPPDLRFRYPYPMKQPSPPTPPPPPRPPPPPPPPPIITAPKSILPPVTTLVPYPIAVPIPVPIPIPIPIPYDKKNTMEAKSEEITATKGEKEEPVKEQPEEEIVKRPLRKRKRAPDLMTEEDSKRKTVPV